MKPLPVFFSGVALWLGLLTAPVTGWAWGRADDAVTAHGRRLPNPPLWTGGESDGSSFLQSPRMSGRQGFRNAGDAENLCGDAYQNLTGTTIHVTIVPGSSKDRIAYLFVKQSPDRGWEVMAYSQNNIPATVLVPNGGVYCPTMNEGGTFYVTVLNGGAPASRYAVAYRVWADTPYGGEPLVGGSPYGCQSVVSVRTYYLSGNPVGSAYVLGSQASGMATTVVPSNVYPGVCPPPESSGGG